MSFKAETYRVMIGSPSDLTEEREAATDAINEWNALHAADESVVLLPVKWETHTIPQAGIRPQQAINEQMVVTSDILLGMFGTKFGTNTGVADSGTVEEIDQFVKAGKPAMLYFSNRPIAPTKIDLEQYKKLKEFKETTYKQALVAHFSSVDELHRLIVRHLTAQVRKTKASGLAGGSATAGNPKPPSGPSGKATTVINSNHKKKKRKKTSATTQSDLNHAPDVAVQIHRQQDGIFLVSSPEIPELITEGETLIQAVENLSSALKLVIAFHNLSQNERQKFI